MGRYGAVFYKPSTQPVTQMTVSKYSREIKAHIPTRENHSLGLTFVSSLNWLPRQKNRYPTCWLSETGTSYPGRQRGL